MVFYGLPPEERTNLLLGVADWLAERGKKVGIVDSSLSYPYLRSKLNLPANSGASIIEALESLEVRDIREYFQPFQKKKSIFFCTLEEGVPAGRMARLCEIQVSVFFRRAAAGFEYLLIDGDPELSNPISGVGLHLAARVYVMVPRGKTGNLWLGSYGPFLEKFRKDWEPIRDVSGGDKVFLGLAQAIAAEIRKEE